jgi:regulator of protease activity HflC (stomatin/prohibitin superfamily)
MLGFVLFLVIAIPVAVILLRQVRRAFDVRDAEGRRIRSGMPARLAVAVVLLVALLVAMVTSVRVVPVGHGLVIFNTITKGFRLSRQGVTIVWPVISQTEQYDLRRLEYTMSSTQGEGKRANLDDSLWSPTKEGLQVGID